MGGTGSTAGDVERLAEQLAADDHPVDLDQRAVGLVVEGHLADPGDDERIDEPEDHADHDRHEQRRAELADEESHVSSLPVQ